jgi:hypothetical protein
MTIHMETLVINPCLLGRMDSIEQSLLNLELNNASATSPITVVGNPDDQHTLSDTLRIIKTNMSPKSDISARWRCTK